MNRRGFLKLIGGVVGGIAIEQAIPFGRVWSFPSKINRYTWVNWGFDPGQSVATVTLDGIIYMQLEKVRETIPFLIHDDSAVDGLLNARRSVLIKSNPRRLLSW